MIWALAGLMLWAIVGLLFALALSEIRAIPEERSQIVALLLICGPICWVLLILCAVFICWSPNQEE